MAHTARRTIEGPGNSRRRRVFTALLLTGTLVWGGAALAGAQDAATVQEAPPAADAAASAEDTAGAGADTSGAASDPMAALFTQKCYACHTIGGGDKTGPDLKGVTSRRDRAWLHDFIKTPRALYRDGDPTAVQLFEDFAPDVMPDQPLTDAEVDGLLDFIAAVTSSGRTFVPAGSGLARTPTPDDIPAGRALFTGESGLSAGGPACISCHTYNGLGGLGGGTLGPDLTKASVTYTQPELVNILRNPAFPRMSVTYDGRSLDDEEIVKLFALLRDAGPREPVGAFDYFLFTAVGILLTAGFIGLIGMGERRDLHDVRRPLVEGANARLRAGKRRSGAWDRGKRARAADEHQAEEGEDL